MFSYKVSISNDISVLLTPPMAMHDYLGPPPIPPSIPMTYVPVAVALDYPAPMFWPPGMAMGNNKLTTKVVHKGLAICLGGHDVGVMIPHMQCTLSPTNSLTPIHVLFSGRSSVFQSSTVLMEGKTVAACTLFNLDGPPAPLIACMDPVSLPIASAPTAHLNTVTFGMSLADYIIAAVTVVVTMAVEFALRSAELPGGWREALGGKIVPGLAGWAAKTAIGLASGGARMHFTDGPAALTIGVGSPYLKVEVQWGRDANGEHTLSVGSQVGPTQGQVAHNVTTGETTSTLTGGDPTGSSAVGGSSAHSGAQTSSTSHSMNPMNWGAPS